MASSARSRTQRLARWIVRHRLPVALAIAAATLFFAYPIFNTLSSAFGRPLPGPRVRIDTRARDLFPDHPYIHAQDAFAPVFGDSALVAVAVAVDEGTIFRPDVIRALHGITRELDGEGASPPYPVNHDQVRSLTHPSTRVFQVDPDGAIRQDVLVARLPETAAEAEALREQVHRGAPEVFGRLVSRDERAALVSAGFVTGRLAEPRGTPRGVRARARDRGALGSGAAGSASLDLRRADRARLDPGARLGDRRLRAGVARGDVRAALALLPALARRRDPDASRPARR